MPSEIDWENEVDFKEDDEKEVDEEVEEEPEEDEDLEEDEEETEEENLEEVEEEPEENEDLEEDEEEPEENEDLEEDEEEPEEYEDLEEYEEEPKEYEDLEEVEEEPEEYENLEEDEEEFEEDKDLEENKEEPELKNRTALFIDGSNISYQNAEKILAAAKEQGELRYAEIFRLSSDKNWNKKINNFGFKIENTFFTAENRNDIIKSRILNSCNNIDIVCISANIGFYEEIIKELKARQKTVVLISIPNATTVLKKACDKYIKIAVQSNTTKKTEPAPTPTPKTTNGIVYIDGSSISPKRAEDIIAFAKTKGNVKFTCVFTVKGGDKAKKWSKRAAETGIQNICMNKNTKKSDFAKSLIEDMMIRINGNDFLCIATCNRIFASKVKEIHNLGKKVIILSDDNLTPKLFKICDEVYDLKNNQLYPNYEYTYKKCTVNATLFIDGENITHEYANMILSKAWEQGNLDLNFGGVYCREEDNATKPWKLKAELFKLNTNKVKGKAAKNKVDNAIIADVLKCVKENENITTFCIASHDKDYAKTVIKLRKAGKRVCVIGKLNMVSDEMRFLCDEFIPI